MSTWSQITPAALLGISRGAPAVELPAPFGELLAGSESEEKILRTCGVLGIVDSAAKTLPTTTDALPEPAPDEQQGRPCPPELATLAGRLLEDIRLPLVEEMCTLFARASIALPPRLIPSALEAGRKTTALRDPLRSVLGQRGAWLAKQNPDWSFAVLAGTQTADARIWDEGDAGQRSAYLRQLRSENPAEARTLLEASFTQDTARDRTILLPALEQALSPNDEPFLAQILAEDRSKEVRQLAAILLSQIPGSTLSRSIAEWLEPCIRTERKLLRTVTVIEPPATFDPKWKSVIEEKTSANMKMGERAWWLVQLVSFTPLAWWEKRLESTPSEILTLASKSDWKDAMIAGFRVALARQPVNPRWTLAFMDAGISHEEALTLARSLPPSEAAEAFQRMLSKSNDTAATVRVIEAADFSWTPEFWRMVRQKIPQILTQQDWRFRAALAHMACRVPPASLQENLNWPDAPFYLDAIADFSRIIDQRKTLHHHLNP